MGSLNPSSTMQETSFNYVQNNWIPVFEGENYECWSIQMKTLYISQGLWTLIQNGYTQPKDASKLANWDLYMKRQYEEDQKRDASALSLMHRGVSMKVFPKIMAATTAMQAWQILQREFKGNKKLEGQQFYTSQAATSVYSHVTSDDEYADIDWDSLGFSLTPTDYMYVMKSSNDNNFVEGQLTPFRTIELSPGAGVLNYGQGLFEGMKAHRREDGRIVLFRPDQNALRMEMGAKRMYMPSPSFDQFMEAVKQTALANKRWSPPHGKGSLYIRPMILGTGSVLGLSPASEYTFLTFASPVRNYFKQGSAALNLYVESEYDRASPGGAGGVKAITNYAPALKPLMDAKKKGFSDVLYLDSVNKKYVEEVSASNIFMVKGNTISTSPTKGTILPGVTRKSVIELARDLGYSVEERLIPIEELLEADEAFCTGTAVVICPVGSITYQSKRVEYNTDNNSVCKRLLSTYLGIHHGSIEDKKGWIVEIN